MALATALTMLVVGTQSAHADPFTTSFDNAYLKTGVLQGSGGEGVDVLDVPPGNAALVNGDLDLVTDVFSAGTFNSDLVTVDGVQVAIDFQQVDPITGIMDMATGQVITNPSAYLATLTTDPTPGAPGNGDEDTCVIGDEPGGEGEGTPDLVLEFSTDAGYPDSPYEGDRFTADLPNLATHALNDGAIVATWSELPAPIPTGPSDCTFASSITQGPGALWMADDLAAPTLATAPDPIPPPGPILPPDPRPPVVELPPPVVGKTVNVKPVRGTILIRRPGQRRFAPLEQAEAIPVNSLIDTNRGRIRIVSATGRGSGTRTGEFNGGLFRLRQGKKPGSYTEMRLAGKLSCPKRARQSSSATVARARRKPGRLVWGSGKGKHRSTGKNSSASVRGTVWLVWDRCDGTTLTRVKKGRVAVRDFVTKRTVTLRRGHSYVAGPRTGASR